VVWEEGPEGKRKRREAAGSGSRRGVLCCAVLCCAVLCCAVLCCAVLCCAVPCCAVLCRGWVSAGICNPESRASPDCRVALATLAATHLETPNPSPRLQSLDPGQLLIEVPDAPSAREVEKRRELQVGCCGSGGFMI